MTGLYIHVPFCARACPYCDFDFVVGRHPPTDRWLEALEVERCSRSIPRGRPVTSVYIGGGTPSLLGAAGLRRLMAWIERSFDTSGAIERTVELNPEHVDDALLDAVVSMGVDRVSLGIQSLASGALMELGRVHRAEQAQHALRSAAARGLRVSADLIIGWPGQTRAGLHADIDGVLDCGVEHLSVYALTIESGTPWESLIARGRRRLPDADVQAERLEEASARLRAAGWEHYEVASYARSGARAHHNLAYWTWTDYLGLGPSAASARYQADGSVARRTNRRGFARWREHPGRAASEERLGPEAAAAEGLWLGLRVLTGVSVAMFLQRFGGVDQAWMHERTARQVRRGNLEWTDAGYVRVAPGRWLWHDTIAEDLLAGTHVPR